MATSLKYIDNSVSKFKDLSSLIKVGFDVTKDIAEDIDETDEGKEMVKELRDIMVEYARLEREVDQYSKAAADAKTIFSKQYDAETKNNKTLQNCQNHFIINVRSIHYVTALNLILKTLLIVVFVFVAAILISFKFFDETLKELTQKNSDEELTTHKNVQGFLQTVWSQHFSQSSDENAMEGGNDGEDDEIQLTQLDETQKFICPITKVELVDPVKSSRCGHTYSRKAIETHIEQRKHKARCPIPGCVSSITLDDLEEDQVLAFQIRKKKKKEL